MISLESSRGAKQTSSKSDCGRNAAVKKESEHIVRSPLRYPGGKRRLTGYISEILRKNDIRPTLFVEPFAGGASVALDLLSRGLVDTIALGEKDPLVAAFWKVVFTDADWLINELESTSITLKNWKEIRSSSKTGQRERAFACLFLNRTSFSGILHSSSGPIGGMKQISSYHIDCRFPVQRLIKRIRDINALSSKVELINEGDWKETMDLISKGGKYPSNGVFYYLDPPFFHKANRLYPFFFADQDHLALCHYLSNVTSPWLVSYDPAKEIIEMYSNNGFSARTIDVLYSITADGTRKESEIILTNLPLASNNKRTSKRKSE